MPPAAKKAKKAAPASAPSGTGVVDLRDAAPAGTLPAGFKSAQARKAVDALLKHQAKVTKEREETELIPRDEHVWLSINTKTGSTRKKLMPIKIQLPNPPLPPPPTTSVCLISKDPQREYKDLLEKHNIKFISRVVGVDKLKGKFKPFEPRRQLCADHDMFLCDDRVLNLMPKLLGKIFFTAKKQPIPVNLQRKDLKAELGRAIACTYFHPSTGTSNSIRIATAGVTSPEATLANLLAALPAAVNLIPGGWDNVLSVGIKTSSSVLLPVWSSPLSGRFDAKGAANGEEMEVEEEEEPKRKTPAKAAAAAAPKEVKEVKETKKVAAAPSTPKKKSSTIGSTAGGAARKSKAEAIGAPKPKAKKAKAAKK